TRAVPSSLAGLAIAWSRSYRTPPRPPPRPSPPGDWPESGEDLYRFCEPRSISVFSICRPSRVVMVLDGFNASQPARLKAAKARASSVAAGRDGLMVISRWMRRLYRAGRHGLAIRACAERGI